MGLQSIYFGGEVLKVNSACVCINCDEVFEPVDNENRCPACASRVTVFLSKWLLVLMDRPNVNEGVQVHGN